VDLEIMLVKWPTYYTAVLGTLTLVISSIKLVKSKVKDINLIPEQKRIIELATNEQIEPVTNKTADD